MNTRTIATRLRVLACAAVVAASAGVATAQTDPAATIKSAVEAWLKGRYQVDGVQPTPLPGIYEVRIGFDLFYVDAKGQYAFVEGQMVDLKTGRSLTKERTDALLTIDFKELPLDLAIKQVLGKGTRVVAVFEDPNCGHCRNLRRELLNVRDVTIYTFPYPILAADSDVKARQAWCAADRIKAWNELMLQGRVPGNDGSCENPIKQVQELGRRLRVSGTPTLFFANGKRVPGAVPAPQLNQLIDENSGSS
ncbi:MAG TPA: DsbC family protein [Burkholderiaceae bacterium]|jgi:thiol:disulfide interchange protein DsbC|nr:DsbC family protein [Burkholderiaceae bacterium]